METSAPSLCRCVEHVPRWARQLDTTSAGTINPLKIKNMKLFTTEISFFINIQTHKQANTQTVNIYPTLRFDQYSIDEAREVTSDQLFQMF